MRRIGKVLTISLVLMLAVLMLPSLQTVQAKQDGPTDFIDWLFAEGGQPINVFWGPQTIVAGESSFVVHGWFIESHDLGESMPARVQVFIGGKEIKLKKFFCVNNELDGVIHCFLFYKVFEAGYFTPGQYDIQVVWSTKTGILLDITQPFTVLAG